MLDDYTVDSNSIPVVAVANSLEPFFPYLNRAQTEPHRRELFEFDLYQQDQCIFWPPFDKLLITSAPLQHLEHVSQLLCRKVPKSLTPASSTHALSLDIARDKKLIDAIVEFAGSKKQIHLLPYAATPQFLYLVRLLREKYGLAVFSPESIDNLPLRDYLDRKSGFRDFIGKQSLPSVSLPEGVVALNLSEAYSAIKSFQDSDRWCIAKPDKGEAGVGIEIFEPQSDYVWERLLSNTFLSDDPIIVEEFFRGSSVTFPSSEAFIGGSAPTLECTYVCQQRFDAPLHLEGCMISPSYAHEPWYPKLMKATLEIGDAIKTVGYRGHFDLDCVAHGDAVYVLELNARRTSGTHVDEFARQFVSDNYFETTTVSSIDFLGLKRGCTYTDIISVLGDLVASPQASHQGIVPCEASGIPFGRFSGIVFAGSDQTFDETLELARDRIRPLQSDASGQEAC